MTRGADEMLNRVLEALEAVGQFEVGRGWKDRVNRRLGKSQGFISHAIERRNLRLDALFSTLDVLEKDISEFLLEVSVSGRAWDPIATIGKRALELDPDLPRIVKKAREWLSDPKRDAPPELGDPIDLPVHEIDDLRYSDPRRAASLAETHLEELLLRDPPERSRCLVLVLVRWASARRRCDDPDAALWVLMSCIQWAARTVDFELRGDLYRRLAYSYCDHFADYEGCLAITDRALAELITARSEVGVARCLVDRGIWLFYLGRYEESLSAHLRSLEALQFGDARHRYTCHECRAQSLRALGRLDEMWKEIERAREFDAGPLHSVTLVWLEGSVAAEEGQYDKAEAAFLQCIRLYSESSPVNAALVSLDLIDLYLAHQRPGLAQQTAGAMFPLIQPLERFPVAAAAVAKLVRSGAEARLSSRLLQATRKTILWARAQRPARASRPV